MKKKALALGLILSVLIQPISSPASFAADTPMATENTAPAETDISYTHSISDAGLELIKSFEGFSAYPVWDYQQYSYGYGSYVDSSTVYEDPNSPTGFSTTLYPDGIPEREAAELLRDMIEDFNVNLNKFLETNKIELNQNQFDALASFGYNLGKYIWSGDYTILRMLKAGEHITDPEAFIAAYCQWCHAGGQFLQGLYDRRQREMNIFYSEIDLSDPNADLYVVNASKLYVRAEPTTSASILGSLTNSQVIRVHKYSEDELWAFTSYCGYFGWVNMGYLVRVNEASSVLEIDADGKDAQGITYTFDTVNKTATVGNASLPDNSSGYTGKYAGEVILSKSLLYNGEIYTLTAISDTAFTDCQSIQKIYIPPCVTDIGENAFKDSSLTEILYTEGSYAEGWADNSPFTATDFRCRAGHSYGEWAIVQTATDSTNQTEERSCSICRKLRSRSFERLEIVSFPNKTEYKEGEQISADGLALEIVYTDGTRIKAPSFKIVEGDTSKPGKQTVTVGYSVLTTRFEIEVSQKTLTSISVSKNPSKLTYIEGAALETDGLAVKANYDNGSSTTVTEYSVSGYDPNKIGKQKITVTYNGFTATFEVTVKAKSLTAFSFASYPNKLEYFCGEAFDPTGMVLKLTYDNGTVDQTDSGFKISGYNPDLAGTQKVKISYGGISHTIQVVVILNHLSSDNYTTADGFVTVTDEQLTVAKLTSKFEAGDRITVLKDGKILPKDSPIGTGMTIQLHYNASVQDEAIIIISGDLSGDGKCSVSDFVALSDYFVGRNELSEAELAAADVNLDGKLDLADSVALYDAANIATGAVALSTKQ